jgi:hypothetical protein
MLVESSMRVHKHVLGQKKDTKGVPSPEVYIGKVVPRLMNGIESKAILANKGYDYNAFIAGLVDNESEPMLIEALHLIS